MAFLDNSGDIILDAVLTDTGRYRLAQGNGSFKIAKFALGDDEIDYSLYNKNDPNGSAYFDLNILQTPILEAFTNNASSLKSKLLTVNRTDLLYLPILKLNDNKDSSSRINTTSKCHIVSVDETTRGQFLPSINQIDGASNTKNNIRVDQGLDTINTNGGLTKSSPMPQDLNETQYIIEIDNRLGTIVKKGSVQELRYSFIDDDNIATYYFSLNIDDLVKQMDPTNPDGSNDTANTVINGTRGTKLEFSIKSTTQLKTTDYLFDILGSVIDNLDGVKVKYIDTTVRVTGATTGYRLDIPVRFVKKTS